MPTFSSDQQAFLINPDLQSAKKEFDKRAYMLKRLIYDKLHDAIVNCDAPNRTKQELLAIIHNILHMQNSRAEKVPLQQVMTIKEFEKSESDLLKAVAKRVKEDAQFFLKLDKYLVQK